MLRLLTGVVAASLLILGWARMAALEPVRERGLLPIQPATPYIRYLPQGESRYRALVVHGLNSSKEFMHILSDALADVGFEVYAIDLPGHGDSAVGFNAILARQVVEQAIRQLNPDTAIGHSLGAGLLLDLAPDQSFRKLVLMSPPPTPIDQSKLQHTLVTTGAWDIPAINEFVPRLQGVELRQFAWAGHSSAPLNPAQIREIVHWIGGDTSRLHTVSRIAWLAVMFGAAFLFGFTLLPRARAGTDSVRRPVSFIDVILAYVVAGGIALVLLRFVLVFGWLRLFAADYLVSFLFVVGLLLMVLARWRENPALRAGWIEARGQFRPTLIALAAATYVIGVMGFVIGSNLMHMPLSSDRWWRFPIIAAATLPLFFFDEIATRRVGNQWRRAAAGILTRALLVAFVVTGVLVLNRQAVFLVVLAGLNLMFWVTLWFATELVSRRVQSPCAAALFAAVVQGWMFAAWSVTI